MDAKEMKQLNENINKVWSEMKVLMGEQDTQIKTFGEASQETKNAVDSLNAKITELETKMSRPAAVPTDIKEAAIIKDLENRKAYGAWMRKGEKGITPEQLKVMTVANDETGGYLCMPETLAGEMIKDIVEYSPVRGVARVRSTSARSVKIRKKTGNITAAQWVGEIGSRSNLTGMTFGMVEVPVHEMAGYVDISNQDLADPDFDLEAELRLEYAEQFGVTEGTSFISGTGVNSPEGILTTGVNALAGVAGGHATELQADGLIDIVYTLKTAYVAGSNWLLNRNTLKAVRKLKDGNGNYIWTPALGITKPSQILEHSYVECPDMPDIGANTYPIVFGDIKKLYMVIDRTIIETIRDPYTQAGTGTTRFYAYKRVGGQIIQKEAAKKLKIATSV